LPSCHCSPFSSSSLPHPPSLRQQVPRSPLQLEWDATGRQRGREGGRESGLVKHKARELKKADPVRGTLSFLPPSLPPSLLIFVISQVVDLRIPFPYTHVVNLLTFIFVFGAPFIYTANAQDWAGDDVILLSSLLLGVAFYGLEDMARKVGVFLPPSLPPSLLPSFLPSLTLVCDCIV